MSSAHQPQAYYNGKWIPAAQAAVPVWDTGFVLGATVAEQLRTFNGKLFRLDAHLERLRHSLELVGVDPGVSIAELGRIAQDLATANYQLLAPGDDLNLTMFFTPGVYPTMAALGGAPGPTSCIHTFPIPFQLWSGKYTHGDAVVTTDIEQVSPRSWPRELKCRSRMHYYLADQHARQLDPGARALMIDGDGFVTEATTANLLAYYPDAGLVGPPKAKVLPGVSLKVLLELARDAGIAYVERDLTPADVAAAQEVLLASTTVCVVPVVRFNRQPVGGGKPGPIYRTLIESWSRLVEVDIVAQAERFADRK